MSHNAEPLPLTYEDTEVDVGNTASHGRMSGGAITGLCIGLVLLVACIVLLVICLLRFRHYWSRRKHAKILGHAADIASNGSQNPVYSSGGDRRTSAECWTNDPYGLTAMYLPTARQSQFGDPWFAPTKAANSTAPYPAGGPLEQNSIGFGTEEPVVVATHVSTVQADRTGRWMPQRDTNRPVGAVSMGAYHLGDLSLANTDAISRYSRAAAASELTVGARALTEPGASTTDSSGTQVADKTAGQKLRSKVRKVARVSQISVSRLQTRRTSKLSGSKRSRPKRKSRASSSAIDPELAAGPEPFGGAMHDDPDDLGSLDNDAFLNSLELAIFPGLTGDKSYQRVTQASHPSRVRFTSAVDAPPLHKFSDETSIAFSDLGLGKAPHRPPSTVHDQTYRPNPNFRFPAPGPPVAGWAHQFGQAAGAKASSELQPKEVLRTNVALPSKHLGSKSDSVPLLPPPPNSGQSLERFSRRKCSTESSLANVWQCRPAPQARQQSEPRKRSREMEQYPSSDTFTQHSDYGFNCTLAGSLSTVESVIEPATGNGVGGGGVARSQRFEGPLDSGYQDSLTGTTLEFSARSMGTATLSSNYSPMQSPSSTAGNACPVDTQHSTSGQKPKLIGLCNHTAGNQLPRPTEPRSISPR